MCRSTGNGIASRPYAPRSGAEIGAAHPRFGAPEPFESVAPEILRGVALRVLDETPRTSAGRSSLCRPPAARAPEIIWPRRPPSWCGLARARTRPRPRGRRIHRIVHTGTPSRSDKMRPSGRRGDFQATGRCAGTRAAGEASSRRTTLALTYRRNPRGGIRQPRRRSR